MTTPRSILKWPGSKRRMLKLLLPKIQPHVCYCDHFAGGLALLFGKERSPVEVVNDINDNLVGLYRNLQFHLPALLNEINWLFSSRRNLKDFIAQPGVTELQRAARFLLVNRTSFSGGMKSFAIAKTEGGGAGFDREKITELLHGARERLNNVVVENLSYERSFENYDSKDTFHFMDPPYVDAPTGAYAGWTEKDMRVFRKRVGKLKGNFLITVNDSPLTRDLFAGCKIEFFSSRGGLCNNRTHSDVKFGELIITPK